jgi:polar amino acid transport system substrate-binding protein
MERLMLSMRASRRVFPAAGAVLLAVLLPGCAPSDGSNTPTTAASVSSPAGGAEATCNRDDLSATKTAGTLTVGTDKPAYDPWFSGDDPANGKGFESAVAYAVAEQLGYPKEKVKWVTAAFNSVIQPGPKKFDVDINQFSITEDRKKAVDFSSGYYDVSQSVVAVRGGKAASATSIADLKDVKLGAQVGTTSYRTITDVIKPSTTPAVFDDNDKAKLALANGQIDALVVDLPTGLYLAAAEIKNGVGVGPLAHHHRVARAVRHGPGEGQQADQLRQLGGRHPALERNPEEAGDTVADGGRRGAGALMTGAREAPER